MNIAKFVLGLLCISMVSCKNTKQPNSIEEKNTGIHWMSLEEAEQASATNPKDIYIMVHADWCPKCERFKTETYVNPKVIKDMNDMFYPVMINAHEPNSMVYKGKTYSNPEYNDKIGLNGQNSYHEILFELDAKSIPSVVFLNEKLEVVGSEMGFKEAGELRSLMRLYAE